MIFETFLVNIYGQFMNRRIFRNIITKIIYKLDGDEFTSNTLRKIYRKYYQVEIGLYSHGGCFKVGNFDRHTTIGRYCSIATTVRGMNRNHPMEFQSMHGLFFNPQLGYVSKDIVEYLPLEIGHDVWIGHNAIIMPSVRKIATGSVIGAGAVVNKDVPPYAVVVGNPGRVVRFRFPKETIEELLQSRWWEKSIDEISHEIEKFQKPLENLENNT